MDKKEFLAKLLDSSDCKTKLVATHKVTDAQKKLWQDYKALIKKAQDAESKAMTAKKKFWNKIEGDLNDFDHNLKIDDDNWVIEVHEDDCENCDVK